jgi:autotransporter family porin
MAVSACGEAPTDGRGVAELDRRPSAAPTSQPAATPSPNATPTPRPSPTRANAPNRFGTVAPGRSLPSGAQCATWVRSRPIPENKGVNRQANRTTGHRIPGEFFAGDEPAAAQRIAPRVDGQFTGTTAEILRWAACKWGIDEDLVRAQAAIESWWRQDTRGDWGTDAAGCAPGHGLGQDGRPGECPQSYGILQDRYPYQKTAWPGIATSTAMNADVAYAIWRACFDGYETWLNTVERGRTYAAGDAWGCMGRWFSGRWHTAAAEEYIGRVRGYLDQRIWEQRDFQQP